MFIILIITISNTVLAVNTEPYHMKLLAVQENGEIYIGSDADLYLELKEGSGRVFLETFPLTKMDTQISTRFAKDIACNHFKLDCNNYDFIYTIKSKSNIIGGPSAGAAISALTTIALMDLEYDKDVTITGTINSGGIVGMVGGVKEKLEAASQVNLKKVLIAKGNSKQKPLAINNETSEEQLDLLNYAKENLSLEVIEVVDLDEVLFHLTGVNFNDKEFEVYEDDQYKEIMQSLQNILCDRTKSLIQEVKEEGVQLNQTEVNKRIEKSINATQKGDYYSAASFCFGNNIYIKSNYYEEMIVSKGKLTTLFKTLEKKTLLLESKIEEEEIKTISDLQTFMVVKERLNDVKQQIKIFNEEKEQALLTDLYSLLGYAEERYFSALSWTQFFSMDGKKLIVDQQRLEQSCLQKVSEAEERHQYVSLFLGDFHIVGIKEKIEIAKQSQLNQEFELCLIMAAQAKAESNAILSSMGLSDETIVEFLDSKIKAVERIISENSAEETFPILGYSYYQYANNLKEEQPYTGLIYLEYALEMSDLGIYFPEEKEFNAQSFKIKRDWMLILVGFLVGVLVTIIIFVIERGWFRRVPKLKFVKK
jgi:predicted S18 family serine protease